MQIYKNLIRPALFRLPSETAHEIGINSLRFGLGSKMARKMIAGRFACDRFGRLERFGLNFSNPLGVAAGFDKNGLVFEQLLALGFGFVEVGTVTYRSQPGNPKPRMFRLPLDSALINRLGFNNQGTLRVCRRIKKNRHKTGVVGVNIGKNKDVPNELAIENYLAGFDLAFEPADYIAVNVSSPNTPNLRELQKASELEKLLGALMERNRELSKINGEEMKPLLVKIAPDLDESEIEAIVDISRRLELAGIIATNTTIRRENLKTPVETIKKFGSGGLSGRPLGEYSNQVIKKIYKYSEGKLPIIGVGGIMTPADAFAKIAAGASLLQAYTGFVYGGIGFARRINFGLAEILSEKGFRNLDEAVGSAAR